MALRHSPRYRLVIAPLVAAVVTALGAWLLIGTNLLTAGLTGAGAAMGVWAYYRHGPGAAESSR